MFTTAVLFLHETLFNLLTIAFLLRFYFQLTRVSFQHQLAQMLVVVTNFSVKPIRRIVPSLGKIDLSTIVLAYLAQLLQTCGSLWLKDFPFLVADGEVGLKIGAIALIGVIIFSVSIFFYSILLEAILSWINPHTPIAPVLHALNTPILQAVRKLIPPLAHVDLSPLITILIAQLLLTTMLIPFESQLIRSLYA
ncbi:MAG: YggT family protein [Betaproteobacteria bacterium]|nr:YggT family protein [Betaproteobacteria bacterium]